MKFSILMPTYNDAEYLPITIKSVLDQDYLEWELIIIDDGSTDSTKGVLNAIDNKKIKVLYQENQDQLNALLNGAKSISGDYVLFLHSDDTFASESTLSYLNDYLEKHQDIDGVYGNILTMDADGVLTGLIETSSLVSDKLYSILLESRGANPVGDPFIVKRDTFNSFVINNYLVDNTVYYLDYENRDTLKLDKVNPWYNYRVFSENYINSNIGLFVQLNGSMRTTWKILGTGYAQYPVWPCNQLIYKLFRKFKLNKYLSYRFSEKLNWKYILGYYELWKSDLSNQKLPDICRLQMDSVIRSIRTRKAGMFEKPYRLDLSSFHEYKGNDARTFYKDWYNGSVHKAYKDLLTAEFDHIVVTNDAERRIAESIVNFLSLFLPVVSA